jgi:putative addiction module component (TIGR02574 family)
MSLTEVKQKALELTREEQLELSQFLAEAAGHDFALSPEWSSEVACRLEDYDQHPEKFVSREELFKRVRQG